MWKRNGGKWRFAVLNYFGDLPPAIAFPFCSLRGPCKKKENELRNAP